MERADHTATAAAEAPQWHSAAERAAASEEHGTFADRGPAATAQRTPQETMAESPRLAAQRSLNDSLHSSPRMVAQRQQLRSILGDSAQLQSELEDALPVQGQLRVAQRLSAEHEAPPRGVVKPARRVAPEQQAPHMAAAAAASPPMKAESPLQNRTALPGRLKTNIESMSGMSLDHVKVHYNSAQPAQLNALAYGHGSDIHVAQGQEQHLPHEAWHIVQQAQGRVKPTMQMTGGVPVNDDPRLEQEADVMGRKAAAGLRQFVGYGKRQDHAARVRSPTRLSRSYPRALRASGGAIAQLAHLPPDSTGELSDMKFTVDKDKPGEKEITGQQLQTELIEALSKVEDVKQGFGYRLASFRYEGKGTFEKDTDDYHVENHGMLKWPGNIDDHLGNVRALMHGTLAISGQLAYLDENFAKIAPTHVIIIDVDWYLERTQSDVGFHKDSRGTTLFVNLTYNNPQAMQGAATKFDREGQPELEKSFPEEVKGDLEERRESYKKIKPDDKVGDLKEEEVKPYARLSFSDPSVWHSTPLLGHRVEKLPPPTDEKTLAKYLVKAGYKPYLYEGIVNYYPTSTPEERQAVYDRFVNGNETVADDDELQDKLRENEFTEDDIFGYWENYTPEAFWLSDEIEATDKYNEHGISDEIEAVNPEKLAQEVKDRSRRLSIDLTEGRKKQEDLNEEASRPRTFIRTWVRLVPRPGKL